MVKKIVVTGGCGFIGSHLVDALILKGYEVVVIDNLSTGSFLHPEALLYHEDIKDADTINYIFKNEKPNIVFHLAAQINLRDSINNPKNDCEINILGGLNVIEASLKNNVEKFIFSSTGGAIYSESSSLPWNENSLTYPVSPYGLSKLTLERYLELYNRLHGLNYISLRYSNVFGERQTPKGEAGVISIFLDKIKKKEDLVIFGNGEQTRDFIHVSDVVSANLMTLDLNINGTFNVSTNVETSINTVADKLLFITGSNSKIDYKHKINGEILHSVLDNKRFKSLGWKPRVNLQEGLEKTVKNFFFMIYKK